MIPHGARRAMDRMNHEREQVDNSETNNPYPEVLDTPFLIELPGADTNYKTLCLFIES